MLIYVDLVWDFLLLFVSLSRLFCLMLIYVDPVLGFSSVQANSWPSVN